jgi:hypothetical protein
MAQLTTPCYRWLTVGADGEIKPPELLSDFHNGLDFSVGHWIFALGLAGAFDLPQ